MMKQFSYQITRIPLGNVSAYLLHQPGSAILVDTGRKGSAEAILEQMSALGIPPGDLTLAVLTHAHYDHAGSAAAIKEATGCRIMVHSSEADRLRTGFTSLPGGTRWKAKILVGLGRIVARRLGSYPAVEPDQEAGDTESLEPFGFPGRVIHTPGHTSGSMAVWMEGGELISGDTFFGLPGKLHFPPFAEDVPALLESWQKLRDLPIRRIYPAHGPSFPAEEFHRELQEAQRRYV